MSEWKKRNEFNSFNSYKGLLYSSWYQAIADKKFLPPIEASIDMMPLCNLDCSWCNAGRYISNNQDRGYMTPDHVKALVDFLAKWGVRATCFGGGGESTINKFLPSAVRQSVDLGMSSAVITNGTILNEDLLNAYMKCRFLSVSVDAGTSKSYENHKGRNLFDKVLSNINIVVEQIKRDKSSCDVCYKFLITEWNQFEIYDACLLAREIGVRDFYARPADHNHQGIKHSGKKSYNYDIKSIEEQFERCHQIETDNFRVFTAIHKYNEDFTPKKDFSQCYGAPVCIQICADGNVYFCVDTRRIDFYKLGTHYPDPKNILNFWGGEHHRKLVFETGKDSCTSRCTYGPYCKQCEELFIKRTDPMCWEFT